MGRADTGDSGDRGDVERGNLPAAPTRLVGREHELRDLSLALWEARLLPLCGPGGVGKTRLAVALADAVRQDFAGGVWWVDLSATTEPRLVAQAVSASLLPAEPTDEQLTAALADQLADATLIVLDNCEQVVDGCADLVETLNASVLDELLTIVSVAELRAWAPGAPPGR